MKDIFVEVSGRRRFGGGSGDGSVVNLRPDSAGRWRPVGTPVAYPAMAGARPLARFVDGGSVRLLGARGRDVIECGTAMTAVKHDDALPGEAWCAMQTGADTALVMTDAGAVVAQGAAGAVTVRQCGRRYPDIRLWAADRATVTTEVDGRQLSREYGNGGGVAAADRSAIVSDMSAAYCRLVAEAAARGYFAQPVLARYRLVDDRGHVLFTSAPVLLGHSSGGQLASPVPLFSQNRQWLDAYTLSLRPWSARATVYGHGGADVSDVAAAEIYFTPMIHPYHPEGHAQLSVGRASSPSEPMIYAALPGRENGLCRDYTGAVERMIVGILGHIDQLEQHVATISRPFASGATRTVEVEACVDSDVVGAARAVTGALRRRVRRRPLKEVLLSAPHTFMARCCAADTATVAWADVSVERFEGYSPAMTAAATDAAAAWTADVTVRFADGSGVRSHFSGTGHAPLSLGPVLSYPSPDAVELDIAVRVGTTVYSQAFALTPVGSGAAAVYVAPRGEAIVLPTLQRQTLAVTGRTVRYDDLIVLAAADAPLTMRAYVATGHGRVHAVAVRTGAEQNWDFGRSRFIIGAEVGLLSLATNTSQGAVSTKLIYHGGVRRADTIAAADGGEFFAVAAGELVHIGATGRVSVFDSTARFVAVAYCMGRGELWCLAADGTVEVFCRNRGWTAYRRTDVSVDAFDTVGIAPLAVTPSGVADIADEIPASYTDVHAGVVADLKGLRQPCAMAAMMEGDDVDVAVAVYTARLDGTPGALVRRMAYTGRFADHRSHPLTVRPLRWLNVTVDGTVTPDFALTGFVINIR